MIDLNIKTNIFLDHHLHMNPNVLFIFNISMNLICNLQ